MKTRCAATLSCAGRGESAKLPTVAPFRGGPTHATQDEVLGFLEVWLGGFIRAAPERQGSLEIETGRAGIAAANGYLGARQVRLGREEQTGALIFRDGLHPARGLGVAAQRDE